MSENNPRKRVALYARVSTYEQHAENQIEVLRQVAQQRNLEIVGEYTDHISGAKARRPQLDKLLSDARHGRCDVVMVTAFDRLGRSVVHLLHTIDELKDAGVEFVSLRENVDTQSATGKVVTAVVAAIGEFERELIRERVKTGMERAKREGRRVGRPPLDINGESVMLDRRRGYSLKEIAKRQGASKTTIGRILKNYKPDGPQGSPESPSQTTESKDSNVAA